MRAQEAVTLGPIAATTQPFGLQGGLYQVAVVATFGGGNVVVEQVGPNGTYLTVTDPITANGGFTIYIPPGQYRLNITTATGLYATIVRVPSE